MTDETLLHDLQCNHVALHRDGDTIYSRAIAEVQRLTAERAAYRDLAVSYGGLIRVSEQNIDDLVRARFAQQCGPTAGVAIGGTFAKGKTK